MEHFCWHEICLLASESISMEKECTRIWCGMPTEARVRGPKVLEGKINSVMLPDEEWNWICKVMKSEASLKNKFFHMELCFSSVVEKQHRETGNWAAVFCIFFWCYCGDWLLILAWRDCFNTYTLTDVMPGYKPSSSHLLTKVWTITYRPWPGLFCDKVISVEIPMHMRSSGECANRHYSYSPCEDVWCLLTVEQAIGVVLLKLRCGEKDLALR